MKARNTVLGIVLGVVVGVGLVGCGQSSKEEGENPSTLEHIKLKKTQAEGASYSTGEIQDPGAPLSEETEGALEFTPTAASYQLPVSLESVPNLDMVIDQMNFELSPEQREGLSTNGVLALESGEFNRFGRAYNHIYDTFGYAYDAQDNAVPTPIFVTSDSLLHMYHLFFDQLLKLAEMEEFTSSLKWLAQGMVVASTQQQQVFTGDLAEASRRNKAFFTVAARLLDPEFAIDADVETEVLEELETIAEAKGLKKSLLLNLDCPESCNPCEGLSQLECKDFNCTCEDYSQYIPRGHYTQSEELSRYFRAMMWLGRITLRMKSDMETYQAVLATDALKTLEFDMDGDVVPATKLWHRMMQVTSFFVGNADDLTFYEYDAAVQAAFGDDFDLEQLPAGDHLAQLRTQLSTLRNPQILSGFVAALLDETAETKGWRFMGQRFTPDSYVLGQMVWDHVQPDLTNESYSDVVSSCISVPDECVEITPEQSDCICYAGLMAEPENPYGVCRLMPRGSDVMAVLGSDAAFTALAGDERYCQFSQQLSGLVTEFDSYTTADWTKNAYWSWLFALKKLVEPAPEGYPVWMHTFAWKAKQLNAALASWTQLRHDTILYVKQSYTPAVAGTSGPPELVFAGYVEPVPEFYHRLAFLSRFTRSGLTSFDLLPPNISEAMVEMEGLLGQLTAISIKELTDEEFTQEEEDAITHVGDTMEGIIQKVASVITVEAEIPDECVGQEYYCIDETDTEGDAFKTSLVADVHTDGNTKKVLETAVGNVDWLLVVHATPSGQLVLSVGPIFTYYEFPHPMSERLTDEAWREMLETDAPARPEWIEAIY